MHITLNSLETLNERAKLTIFPQISIYMTNWCRHWSGCVKKKTIFYHFQNTCLAPNEINRQFCKFLLNFDDVRQKTYLAEPGGILVIFSFRVALQNSTNRSS